MQVSGGMYGTEAILSMAPPAYVFGALLVCPLLYAIPSTLICVDIATAYPVDGGMASWIDIAYGDWLGAHHMYWCVLWKMRCVIVMTAATCH